MLKQLNATIYQSGLKFKENSRSLEDKQKKDWTKLQAIHKYLYQLYAYNKTRCVFQLIVENSR